MLISSSWEYFNHDKFFGGIYSSVFFLCLVSEWIRQTDWKQEASDMLYKKIKLVKLQFYSFADFFFFVWYFFLFIWNYNLEFSTDYGTWHAKGVVKTAATLLTVQIATEVKLSILHYKPNALGVHSSPKISLFEAMKIFYLMKFFYYIFLLQKHGICKEKTKHSLLNFA